MESLFSFNNTIHISQTWSNYNENAKSNMVLVHWQKYDLMTNINLFIALIQTCTYEKEALPEFPPKMKFFHTKSFHSQENVTLPSWVIMLWGKQVNTSYRRSAEHSPPMKQSIFVQNHKMFSNGLKKSSGFNAYHHGQEHLWQFGKTDFSPRLSGEWISLLGGGGKRGRVTNNLISFPIQHAKTHTSATMRSPQQLLPEQKAGSSFSAPKTKHIIFYALP